jgi:hypothetical protein
MPHRNLDRRSACRVSRAGTHGVCQWASASAAAVEGRLPLVISAIRGTSGSWTLGSSSLRTGSTLYRTGISRVAAGGRGAAREPASEALARTEAEVDSRRTQDGAPMNMDSVLSHGRRCVGPPASDNGRGPAGTVTRATGTEHEARVNDDTRRAGAAADAGLMLSVVKRCR